MSSHKKRRELNRATDEHTHARIRAELVNALAACKAKDEALITLMKYNPRTRYVGGVEFGYEEPVGECLLKVLDECDKALAIQPDDSALEAIVKKAGEVMREWCASESCRSHEYDATKAIRTLPAVTLEDLK